MWTEITRPKYEPEGQRYASDVTDAEWALIEPHMPAAKPLGRPRDTELRAVLDAILADHADDTGQLRPQIGDGEDDVTQHSCRR